MTADTLGTYVEELFAVEDHALVRVRTGHAAAGLPEIHVSAEEGRILHLLVRMIGARRVLEIGTLGGYSAIWMARALPPDGRLVTIERDARHAAYARAGFARAGVADRIELLEGGALDVLPTLPETFDAVFIDADKAPMPRYFVEGMRLLRPGGLLLGDNAFHDGRVVDAASDDADTAGIREFNRLLATDRRLVSTILPVRDGLAVGLRVS